MRPWTAIDFPACRLQLVRGMKMSHWILFALSVSAAGCFDVIGEAPPAQCDPERRCTFIDGPVCGADGEVYECESVAHCYGVEVAADPTFCDGVHDQPDAEPDTLPDDVGLPPDEVCDEILPCAQDCPHGHVLDERGCRTCECEEGPDDCGLIGACPDSCVVATDERGCQTCECGPECEPLDDGACLADPACEIVVDNDGCRACECGEDRCGRMFCNNLCENGYLIVDGCPTCQCYQPCSTLPECDLFCENGNQLDPATGCSNSCACREEQCNGPLCALACEFGYRRDESGCDKCECKGPPCQTHEDCARDEHCRIDPWEPFDGFGGGECVKLEVCSAAFTCGQGECGFYYRQDCCPPLTTCNDSLPACPALCLPAPG